MAFRSTSCFFFLCLSFFAEMKARELPQFIENLTTREGLSNNDINAIAQDEKGFLWIGTANGLNRFDGTEVVQYFHRDSSNSIPDNYIFCLKALPGNFLAVGTRLGLSFYNGNNGVFQHFYYKQRDGLDEHNNTVTLIESDIYGNLWVGSRTCIYVFDPQRKFRKVFHSPFTETDAQKRRLRFVEKILPLGNGKVLLALYDGWYTCSADAEGLTKTGSLSSAGQFDFVQKSSAYRNLPDSNERFPSSNLFKVLNKYFLRIQPGIDSLILLDEQGSYVSSSYFPYSRFPYVSWSQQVFTMDSARIVFLFHNFGLSTIPVTWVNGRPVIHQASDLQFQSDEYSCALSDREGNWWLATTRQGLRKVSPRRQIFKNYTLIDQHSGKPVIYEVSSINRIDNALWVATYGKGLFEIDLKSGKQFQHLFSINNDIWANHLWNIRHAAPDTLWIGTQAGMLWYNIAKGKYGRCSAYSSRPVCFDSAPITTQFIDSRGLIWIGLGQGNGLCVFDNEKKKFTHFRANSPGGYPLRYPTDITEDKSGNLWFISDASLTLVKWHRASQQFQSIPIQAKHNTKISDLKSIYVENDSLLWVGTSSSGLLRLDLPKNEIKIYGYNEGLPGSQVNSIYMDQSKKLWLATNNGLSCFDPGTSAFINYSDKDGLSVNNPAASFYYDSNNEIIYGGGPGAVFHFDPEMLNMRAPSNTPVITAMLVNGKPYIPLPGNPIELSARQNDIALHFTAIDLTNGPQTRYAYKMTGEGEDWVELGTQRQIHFSRLSAGHYTFLVRSKNNWGKWSSGEAAVAFYIKPPFTQTVWFYGAALLLIALIFYGLYRFRLKQFIRTEEIRSEISRNLHDEVGSILTDISFSSLLAQKQFQGNAPARALLDRIYNDSQMVSQAMREIVWSINPQIDTLGDALPRMLQYSSALLEAAGIELDVETDNEIEDIKLNMQRRRDLYLIFKEAVSNLAKHSGATRAAVSFRLKGKMLIMTIEDDGSGFDMTAQLMNNGIRNMQERATKNDWQLSLQSQRDKGTVLELKLSIA